MKKLIELDAAIDALGEEPPVWYDGEDEIAERNQWRRDVAAIKALPSAQQWIPCSERLPEDEEEVIVSVRDDSGDNTLDYSSCGWYACAGDFWVVDNEPNYHVVAWMPLPKPWKGEPHD